MEKSFEASMKELTEIVTKLEDGCAELDEALNLFEKGIAISRELSLVLEKAEQRVIKLCADADGAPQETPFGELSSEQ